jgi:uncharacterized protein YcbX
LFQRSGRAIEDAQIARRDMDVCVTALYRYPVKGFSAEPLERAGIAAGETIPWDRAFAVENGASGFDPTAPEYFPKIRFLMLMRNERLAEFATRFDPATGLFSVFRGGALQVEASLVTPEGRAILEAWLAETFAAELRGAPRILSAPGHSFSDRAAKVLHVVNLASLRALEAALGRELDPLRFRPNIVIDGAPAWSELDWGGRSLRLPGITLVGETRTFRCAATNVDPGSARRDSDLDIPSALQRLYGHADFGIYVVAKTAGAIAVGDAFDPAPLQASLLL